MSKTAITSQVEWKEVNWRKAEFAIFKLQKRIYRASSQGNVKQVRRLQKTLVKSWYAKIIATRRVTQENKGKKTAGVDGIKSLKPQERVKLSQNLKLDGKAKPTRRVWIPKPGKKEMRPLGIPTMIDRAKQALAKMALEPEWEAKFEPNSYGFRPGRSTHDAIYAIYASIVKKPKYVLDADIASCFDRIDHNALLKKLDTFPTLRRQIKAWLKSGVIDFSRWAKRKGYQETDEGTPQGGVISPLLANIALHGMEQHINNLFLSTKMGYLKKSKCRYGYNVSAPRLIRYADDFVVICDEIKVVRECQIEISKWLREIGLELKPSKTRLIHTLNEYEREKPGFEFLGFQIRQYPVGKHHSGNNTHGKLLGFKTLIQPEKEKIKRHYEELTKTCDQFKGKDQIGLIGKLNPIIRGWCNYYTPWIASKTFNYLKTLMWLKLWNWAKRRHPKKNRKWIVRKYWQNIQGDRWRFASNRKGRNPIQLLKHTDFPSGKGWIKVEGARSPYDGDEIYWSRRLGDKYQVLDIQKARLIKKQQGKCAYCGLHFQQEDKLEKHHLEQKAKGGNNSDKNIILIHLHCHDLIHGQKNDDGTSKGVTAMY